jgi:methionyl-tRNA synthetase
MAGKFYITTAIDYANGEPHLGHAYEKIGADCVARYRRLLGERVHFVMGMDEHGQKVAQAADEAGVGRQEWVDQIAEQFRHAWRRLAISHDDFIRTTEPRHRRAVLELLRRVRDAGHISEGTYAGYYCVGCEAFKLDKDLENGRCPLHPTREIKWVEEPNYFFDLGAFRQRLLEHYDAHPAFVQPTAKFNEVRNVVREWTPDHQLSVSRARVPWGISWPDDPEHTVYVWIEALMNYLSATGFPDPGYEEIWPADVHVIGPDIVRFHAAIWPAMLLAAGLATPLQVWCHGWINWEGARFSKSAGVAVTLDDIVDRHGPDALRYFVLREVPWHSDGTFTWERFDARYTADLADGYGNLLSRVLAMIARYGGGTVPPTGQDTPLDRAGEDAARAYRSAMDRHLLHDGAAAAWQLVARANGYVEQEAPWQLAKEGRHQELERALAALARCVARISAMAAPFLPNKSRIALEALGLRDVAAAPHWQVVERPPTAGARITKREPLFPKPERV